MATKIIKHCSIDGCDNIHEARGWCRKHYTRWRRGGNPLKTTRIMGDNKKRFFEKIEIVPESGCWIWMGSLDTGGYGLFQVHNKTTKAHRWSYGLHNGQIPNGLHVLHRCDIRPCVNPDHLFLGTNQDNIADMISKNRQARGEMIGAGVLLEKQVVEIKEKLAIFSGTGACTEIAKEYQVSLNTIASIKNGKSWRYLE